MSAKILVMAVSDLGQAMKTARDARGWRQDDAVARAARGISRPQWSKIENGHEDNYLPSTYAAIDRALEWPYGTAQRLAATGVSEAPAVQSGASREAAELEAMRRTVEALASRVERLERSDPPRSGEARQPGHEAHRSR